MTDGGAAWRRTATGVVVVTAAIAAAGELARRAQARSRVSRARAREIEQAQQELRRLADEQAALRRVATLVAETVPNAEVFEAVTREVGLRCDADLARLERFEADGTMTAVAAWSRTGADELAVGTTFALEGASIAALVHETGRARACGQLRRRRGPDRARGRDAGHPLVGRLPDRGRRAAMGRDRRLVAAREPFPPNTESRIAEFTELVATAVANAEARAELSGRARAWSRPATMRAAASCATCTTAHNSSSSRPSSRSSSPGARRRTTMTTPPGRWSARRSTRPRRANAELRELAHGMLARVLAGGGLAAGVRTLVSRLHVPVRVDVPEQRFAPPIEASAYFVVAEALTNVAKHSRREQRGRRGVGRGRRC